MRRRRGQIIILTVLIVAILLLSVVVTIFSTSLVYLRTRSIAIRGLVGAVTSDFKRAMSYALALATRAYYNYSEYSDMLTKYAAAGLMPDNCHNFSLIRIICYNYLQSWKTFLVEAYTGYGVQVSFTPTEMNLTSILNRTRYVKPGELVKCFWYYPYSASVITATLNLNLTKLSFYGFSANVTVGLYLRIYNFTLPPDPADNWTMLTINVMCDEGKPYPYLLIKGKLKVFIPVGGKWVPAEITKVYYRGGGNYTITFSPYLAPVYDPLDNKYHLPVIVVVEDGRGIVVASCGLSHLVFKVRRNTPSSLTYFTPSVYCEEYSKLWSFTAYDGYTIIGGGIHFKPLISTKIRVRFSNGTTRWITLPGGKDVTIWFDHDSRLYGGGTMTLNNALVTVTTLHARMLYWGTTLYNNLSILSALIATSDLRSSVTIEYYGNKLLIALPCPSVTPITGPLHIFLRSANPIIGLVLTGSGTLVATLVARYGVVETLSGNSLPRPPDTRYEVYTLSMDWKGRLYWLGNALPTYGYTPIPLPPVPVKQIRVNVSSDGDLASLSERAVQYELWENYSWHGMSVQLPISLADPLESVGPGIRLVFQVPFPMLSVSRQYVAVWWIDDADAEPWSGSGPRYVSSGAYNDVNQSLYDVEAVGTNHENIRGYADYEGVAALALRSAAGGLQAVYDVHAFDNYTTGVARYRPYGEWKVIYRYPRYTWITAPVRVLLVLNTSRVGDVYDGADSYWSGYYDTLAVVQVVNGTRYVPVTAYVYWENSKPGAGYWLDTATGVEFPEYFALMRNDSAVKTFDLSDLEHAGFIEQPNPGVMVAYWNSSLGISLIVTSKTLVMLRKVGGYDARVASRFLGGNPIKSTLEYQFWPSYENFTIIGGTGIKYTTVLFYFRPTGGLGWLSVPVDRGWINAYIYAPMFEEDYMPNIEPP